MAKKKKKTETVSAAVFAGRIKSSTQYVYQLLKKGTIKKSKDGKIDPVEAMKMIKASRDPARDSKVIPREGGDGEASGDSAAYRGAKTASEFYRAKRLKRAYERTMANVLDAEEVRRERTKMVEEVRSFLLALPDTLPDDFSLEQKAIFKKEIEKTLEGFGERLTGSPEVAKVNGEARG